MSVKQTTRLPFLDGLRGWAALAVVLYHVVCDGMPTSDFAKHWLRTLLPFNGMVAVCLFFVLSGFALSLAYVQSGDRERLTRMAVGRYVRLTIPIFATCLLVFIALKAGIILPASERPAPFNGLLAFDPDAIGLLRFALFDVYFNFRMDETYAGPLWTMGIELIGSVIIFAVLFLVGRREWRWWVYGLLVVGFGLAGSFYVLFVIGAALADIYASAAPKLHAPAALALFLFGAVLPVLAPWEVWVGNLSAVTIFVAVAFGFPNASPVAGRLARWLGKISFPLYLLHGPVMFALGVPLIVWSAGDTWMLTGSQVAVVVASILAGRLFVRVNEFAEAASRTVGRLAGTIPGRRGELKVGPN